MFLFKLNQLFKIFSLIFLFFICFTAQPLASNLYQLEEKNIFFEEKENCLSCHRKRNINTNTGVISTNSFCMECHAEKDCTKNILNKTVSLRVPKDSFIEDRHQYIACIECHTDVARSPHSSDERIACRDCHSLHTEEKTHPSHHRVNCESCHYSKPVALDAQTNRIRLNHFTENGTVISLASHETTDLQDESFCQKCHFKGNSLGAPSSVLPSKSITCIACHNAPVSINSAYGLYWGPLLIAIFGFMSMFILWFKGYFVEERETLHQKVVYVLDSFWKTFFSRQILTTIKTVILDIILHRRILAEGVERWSIHALIYLAFLGRLGLSVLTVIIFAIWPDSILAEALVNKNHPFVAVVHDLLGLFILIGVVWASIQRFIVRPSHLQSKEQDIVALIIIGLLVLVGFILEGIRILITQAPPDVTSYSFIGTFFAWLLSTFSVSWQSVFGVFWYIHVVFWAIFLIYLPFGKLKHIITTPLNLLMSNHETEKSSLE